MKSLGLAWPSSQRGEEPARALRVRPGPAFRLFGTLFACAALGLWPRAAAEAQDSEEATTAETMAAPEHAPPEASLDELEREPAEPREYAEVIDAALAEHAQGHFEEARELLQRAHHLFPNARTLRGLGKVEFELRNYAEAVSYFERALRSPTRPLDGPLRAEVEALLERARTYVGSVSVELTPASAAVLIEGVTVGQGPRSELALDTGEHLMEFRAEGYAPERRAVRVRGGEHVVLRVALTLLHDAVAPSRDQASAQHDGKPLRRRWWVWTLTAAAVAGSATAFALAYRGDRTAGAQVDGGSSGTVLVSP